MNEWESEVYKVSKISVFMKLGKGRECGIEVVRGRPFRSRLVTEDIEQKGKRALPASVTPQSAMELETNTPQYFFSFLPFSVLRAEWWNHGSACV